MHHCEHCLAFVKKGKLASTIDLSRSFVKIDGTLHLGFNRSEVFPILSNYAPDTIIFAGNRAVQISGGGNCWNILKDKMTEKGLLGNPVLRDISRPIRLSSIIFKNSNETTALKASFIDLSFGRSS